MMQRLACLSISDPNHLNGFLEVHGNLVDLSGDLTAGGWGLGFWRAGEMLTRKTPIGPSLDTQKCIREGRARQCVLVTDADAKLRSSRATMQPLRFRDWVFGVSGHTTLSPTFYSRARAEFEGFGKAETTVPGLVMTAMMYSLHRANLLDRRPLNASAYYASIAEGVDRIRHLSGAVDSSLDVAFVLHLKGGFFLGSLGRALHVYRLRQTPSRHLRRPLWEAVVIRDEPCSGYQAERVRNAGIHVDGRGEVSTFSFG